jgi:hypothetical protein
MPLHCSDFSPFKPFDRIDADFRPDGRANPCASKGGVALAGPALIIG